MLKVALVGFGGIAQIHRYAYWKLNREGVPVRLVAACDTDPKKFETVTKINISTKGEIYDELPFNAYSNYREMLEKEKPDLVDICLPTKFHEQISVEVLNMGFSVLCEKPMAENSVSCRNILDTANITDNRLMIAHCVRFQPEYEYLQNAVKDKIYGAVKSAEFYRYTGFPDWGGTDWRGGAQKIGSCLFDLNIHDIDVVEAIFGIPKKLSCKTQSVKYPYDRSESEFNYPEHTVKINGAWLDIDEPFSAGYKVEFENGVLEYNSNHNLTFTDNNGKTIKVAVPDKDMIVEEIRYFVEVLYNKSENIKNSPDSSLLTVYTIEKLFESAEKDGAVIDWGEKIE